MVSESLIFGKKLQKSKKKFAGFDFIRTFAIPSERDMRPTGANPISEMYWRDGRVVECGGLENR